MSQHIDISIKDWRKVPDENKDDLWSIVKEKFEFAPVETEQIKLWVITDIGRKWKTWKYELKKRSFDSSLTVDEIVATQTDSRVEKQDFMKLVARWFCEDVQAISEKKKEIRSKSIEPHVLGTKSFARLANEEKQKTGVQPTRGKLYIISRTKKNGSIVNETAAKVIPQSLLDLCLKLCYRKMNKLASYKNHNPVKNFSNVLNTTNKEVANDSSSVHNHGPSGNSIATRTNKETFSVSVHEHGLLETANSKRRQPPAGSQNKKSAKAVTSPGPSKKITHLSSAEIQLRTKFLEEDSELMKLHQQFVKSGLMSDNEFWCIRKVKQRVGYCRQTLKGLKREDALLLRKFGIQFKGDLAVGNLDSKVQQVEGTIAR
ncbi:Transposase, Ptta/En/Spm [Artemisia annua]|uniref:Transposase, Ptta/En/Spm n=1 Tax=Artemisia annua TaxID=35608 RepID=A0A2U1P2Z8_ARTAN|nr:Transposase, Ptta/En/Spm [Artemisia annua]